MNSRIASSRAAYLMLTVEAYCLQVPAVAVTIVQATGNTVKCPAGDFVLGGDYRYPVESSQPDATRSGWRIQSSDTVLGLPVVV